MTESPTLRLRGARVHNLKGVDLDLPTGGLIALSGVSGSGKSSLAFDTLFVESRRRFSETLTGRPSTGTELSARPELDSLTGLPPALALRQSPELLPGPHSTVGSLSGVEELLLLLFARLGRQHCPQCGEELAWDSADGIVERLLTLPEGARVDLLSPLLRAKAGAHQSLLEELLAGGFARVRVDGQVQRIEDLQPLDAREPHDIDLVVDRLRVGPEREDRLAEAVRVALRAGDGRLLAVLEDQELSFSEQPWCARCGIRTPRPHPSTLGPRGPGACPRCQGSGQVEEAEDRVRSSPCPDCEGLGLSPAARAVRWGGWPLGQALSEALGLLGAAMAQRGAGPSLARVLEEAQRRLNALVSAGLGHLPLSRRGPALSNGELRRLRLAAVAAQELSGVLYVLDEPCAGVHPQDQPAVLELVRDLHARGNTVMLVDHSPLAIQAAQLCLDFGPGAGESGGRVCFQGSPQALLLADTPTGRWLSGREQLPQPPGRRPQAWLTLRGARGHNLQGIDARFPLGCLSVVTGPSGAGKTSLLLETLLPALRTLLGEPAPSLPYEALEGPLPLAAYRVESRAPSGGGRSLVATWAGLWDPIRELWALTQEAKVRGFGPGHFSLGRGAGLCGACQGSGEQELAPDLRGPCPTCEGKRFDRATLKVRYRGLNLADVLALGVSQARRALAGDKRLDRGLRLLDEVGLGYLRLGQPTRSLSGGEAQRLRLAKDLARGHKLTGVVFVLEEPCLGLHPQDIANLCALLHRLVDEGATVLAVEHHPMLISQADWELRLGPGAGPEGGRLVYEGAPG